MGQIVALYQMGIVKKLPDPPGKLRRVFDATKVDASDHAYKRLNMPDAPGMVSTYVVAAMLASAGGMDRARTMPWLPIALAVRTPYDSATALTLDTEEWQENEARCEYRQVATVASVASFALPEAVRAARHLLGRDGAASVARGESVVVFPQGTVLGIESRFHDGAFRLARTLGRPILPIALTGSHRTYEYPFSPRARTGEQVSLRVLPPIPAAEVRATPAGLLCARVERLLKAHALDGTMAAPRRFVPERDGWWDDYAYDIDPAFPLLAADVARHRAAAATAA